MAETARRTVFREGDFLSSIAMITGVITIDSCTIKAVLEPEVLFRASMQKVLLTTEARLIREQTRTAFLLKPFNCFLNNIKVAANPMAAQIKSIENGGRKPKSIFDQMYEEPQNRALSSKKNWALRPVIIFIVYVPACNVLFTLSLYSKLSHILLHKMLKNMQKL